MNRSIVNSPLKWSWWFLTGATLVNTLVFAFIILCLTFITGHGLAAWQFPLALIAAIALNYFAAGYFTPETRQRSFLTSSCWVLGIVIFSAVLAVQFYDISFDGQMYHLEPALQMKAGWNPFKQELPADFNQAIWLNHYGKGVEGPQATLYALTNRIESTKATNFILLAGSFCLCMALFLRLDRFSSKKNVLFSLLLALNPISFYQLLSTYVDGQLASYLLCYVVIACFLFLDINRYFLWLLAGVLIVIINIKFTAIVFAAIFTIGMLLTFWLIRGWKTCWSLCKVTALATVFAIGVVGYFPYVINTVRYHDPIYPGVKALQTDVSKQMPLSFLNSNGLHKFFVSFFSHTDDLHIYLDKNPDIPAKIPFTLNKTDVFNAAKPFVVHMAGFGPFFSGICISALLIFILFLVRVKNRRSLIPVFAILAIFLFSIVVISEAWFARYIPQLWFLTLLLLIITESDKRKYLSVFRNAIYAIMLLNISFCLAAFPYVYYQSVRIQYELDQLKASGKIIPVQFTYYTSNRARFTEQNIPFRETNIPDSTALFMINSSTKYLAPKSLPEIQKPWILRTGERLTSRMHF